MYLNSPDELDALKRVEQDVKKSMPLLAAGKLDEADQLAQETVAYCEKKVGRENVAFASALTAWADIKGYRREFDECKRLGVQAVGICEKVLGLKHWRTSFAAFQLAKWLWCAKEAETTMWVLNKYLAWLNSADIEELHPIQQHVRRQIEEWIKPA